MAASSILRQGALGGKEQVLGELLADRGAARDDLALFEVFFVGLLHAFPVESFMINKTCVLGGNQRTLEIVRDFRVWHPFLLKRRIGILALHDLQPRFHERTGGRVEFHPPADVREQPHLIQNQQGEEYLHAAPNPA